MPDRSIGGIPEDEIASHFAAAGLPGQAGADRVIRFLRKLTILISQRWSSGESKDGAVFLLAEKVSDALAGQICRSKPALVNGNDEISGSVWVLNAALANAHSLSITWKTGDGVEQIVSAGMGDLPAVLVDLRDAAKGPQVLFFPNGCADLEVMHAIHIGGDPIDEIQMKRTLDDFYEQALRTPMTIAAGHGDRIWVNAQRGVPQPRPEETIEMFLVRHLKAVYPSHDTRPQEATADGYLDIAIHHADRTARGHPALRCDWVLELKALADRTTTDNASTTNVPEAVKKGLRQTLAYSVDKKSLRKALCVYDLRDVDAADETCFDEIREDADEQEVHLWRWRLLRSAEEGRRQRFPLRADAPGFSPL